MARSLFFDGEVFIQKVTGPGNRPKIVQLEAHRVETPPDRSGEENKTICDGVKINSAGQVLGYYVRTSLDKSELEYKFIPVAEIVHRFVRKRPGQYRGIPFLYPVMNDLHDLDDLQMYEMRAAKDAAIISNVVTNASGEKSAATLRRSRAQIQSQNPNSMPVIKNDDQFYDVQFGTRTVMLKTGEDIKQFRSARPSVTTREYWDYLVAKICAGVGVSRLLVFPFSIQGTVTRADLDISAGLFRTRSKIVESICRDIYEWVIDWAIKYDQRLDGEPQDGTALCVTSHPPRSPNVDVGRNSSAMLAELEAGTRTFQDVYAELGEDWRPQLRQKAKERAYIHALAKQYSTADAPIDPNEIAGTSMTPIAPDPTERSSSSSPATTATP
jgi:capsid protein